MKEFKGKIEDGALEFDRVVEPLKDLELAAIRTKKNFNIPFPESESEGEDYQPESSLLPLNEPHKLEEEKESEEDSPLQFSQGRKQGSSMTLHERSKFHCSPCSPNCSLSQGVVLQVGILVNFVTCDDLLPVELVGNYHEQEWPDQNVHGIMALQGPLETHDGREHKWLLQPPASSKPVAGPGQVAGGPPPCSPPCHCLSHAHPPSLPTVRLAARVSWPTFSLAMGHPRIKSQKLADAQMHQTWWF